MGDIFRHVAYRFGEQHQGQQPEISISGGVRPQHYYFTVKPWNKPDNNPDKPYPFYVKTSPADATVRILNIGPKYQFGMPLKAGSYTVEVSKAGYTLCAQEYLIR